MTGLQTPILSNRFFMNFSKSEDIQIVDKLKGLNMWETTLKLNVSAFSSCKIRKVFTITFQLPQEHIMDFEGSLTEICSFSHHILDRNSNILKTENYLVTEFTSLYAEYQYSTVDPVSLVLKGNYK